MYKFKFADIGEGLHEGKVAEIYLNEGKEVKEGDSLFSVETDKVTSDIPSPTNGKIIKVLMKVGDTIHVGQEIYHIDDGSKDEDLIPEEKAASVVGSIEVSNEVVNFDNMSKKLPSKNIEPIYNKIGNQVWEQDHVLTTPHARYLASEKGIDITQIQGSGFNGRVLVSDVESYDNSNLASNDILNMSLNEIINLSVQNALKNIKIPIPPKEETKLIPKKEEIIIPISDEGQRKKITPIRKAIAKAMIKSWDTVAYTNLVNEVNMTKIWDKRKKIVKPIFEKTGIKITFTALIAFAIIKALKDFPILNAKYDKSKDEILEYSSINLGIAVDTPKGLMVPVIKDANKKSLIEIGEIIINLAKKARDGKLSSSDMQNGTFTLTNYGSVGAMWGVPVINVSEMAILGVGTIVDRVYGDKDGFYNGKVMNITTAADHRWVDGADIGRFLIKVKELLENPDEILKDLDI